MRKIVVILVGLFALLLCSGAGQPVVAHPAGAADTSLSIDSGFSDELLCQREYNSDLNLPGTASEVMPVTVSPSPLRHVRGVERLGVKCGVACGCGGSVRAIPEFEHENLFAAGCAVDYYVYRLRRLII